MNWDSLQLRECAMPALEGVLETVLYVDDFERARAFYEGLFALPIMYSDQRMCAYDVGGRSVLLLFRRGLSLHTIKMPGGVIPPHDGSGPHHVAFSIAADELPAWETRLRDFGIAIEGRTDWPRGGISIYFRDPDRHLLELATPGLWPGHCDFEAAPVRCAIASCNHCDALLGAETDPR
jgi:catechol 2,3-dioxygenase-like lactoylglutathione lyase family enzyme